MNKKNFIYDLKNVKLVIGNGFDRHCGLKSSYNDYFLRSEDKNSYFINWIDIFKNKAADYLNYGINNREDSWIQFDNFDSTNVWDFFFYLKTVVPNISNQKEWLWCDIEKVMFDSLNNNNKKDDDTFTWEMVFNVIDKGSNNYTANKNVYVLACVILKKRSGVKFNCLDEFYEFLLSELKDFEHSFGEFIYDKRYPHDGFSRYRNVIFENNSKNTINMLCNRLNLVSIDSFNYDDIGDDSLINIFHHINGDINYPIFGVDSSFCGASDPRYIFSKTNRRMELEMINDESEQDIVFNNVIVYGHSLGSTDYSYFFPLLDKLDMINFASNKKIVFAFSIFNKDNEYEIRKNHRESIQILFELYAKDKGLISPNRLLDSLTTQNRVITYEIPNLY